jgi:ubiquinone/menaquinone biosynthesis C-methylase UbiE
MGEGNLSFKWFAEHGFYGTVNSNLVDLADIRPGQRIVELACGTGAVTRLLLDKIRGAREGIIIAIDSSATSLREAMDGLGNVRDVALEFIHGQVEALSDTVKERVDGIVFCNGIHYVEDKDNLLGQVSKTLKPGGTFSFNTSFFHGAHPLETEQFYRRWMFKAIRILKSRYNVMPNAGKVQSRRQLTPDQYTDLLRGHGFRIRSQAVKATPVPLEGWVDISRYEDFVAGAMPGVPLLQASEVLQESVQQTFNDLRLEAVDRNWLSVVAQKP